MPDRENEMRVAYEAMKGIVEEAIMTKLEILMLEEVKLMRKELGSNRVHRDALYAVLVRLGQVFPSAAEAAAQKFHRTLQEIMADLPVNEN